MRIVFLGTGEIGLPTLEMLLSGGEHLVVAVVTQPDKPSGRRQEIRPSAIKVRAANAGIAVLQPAKIRDPAVIDQLHGLAPEVIVVMAYGQILPKALLEIPKLACLNLHASLLPRHRGAAPIQAAIEAGDRETGITVMYMAEGLDTGDTLLKKPLRIRRRETGGTLHDRLALLAPEALAEALAVLAQGSAPRIPQAEAEATYAAKLTREHGEIRWTASAAEIERKIRAMNPWPSAYTLLPTSEGPRKLKVFSSIQYRRISGPPGEVLRADKNGILVGAETGAILLRDVQLEGKRRMPARELLMGHPVQRGAVLGAKA